MLDIGTRGSILNDPIQQGPSQTLLAAPFEPREYQLQSLLSQALAQTGRQRNQRTVRRQQNRRPRLGFNTLPLGSKQCHTLKPNGALHGAEAMNPAVLKGNLKCLSWIRPLRGKQHLRCDFKPQDLKRSGGIEETPIALTLHPLAGKQSGHRALRALQKPLQHSLIATGQRNRAVMAGLGKADEGHTHAYDCRLGPALSDGPTDQA